jgi:hypothetical protein
MMVGSDQEKYRHDGTDYRSAEGEQVVVGDPGGDEEPGDGTDTGSGEEADHQIVSQPERWRRFGFRFLLMHAG